jgi:hypothetical protein
MAVRSRSLMLGAGRVEHCSKHKLTAAAGAAAAGAGGGGVRFQGGLKLQLAGCEMGESECTEISAALASLSPSGEDSADDGTLTYRKHPFVLGSGAPLFF